MHSRCDLRRTQKRTRACGEWLWCGGSCNARGSFAGSHPAHDILLYYENFGEGGMKFERLWHRSHVTPNVRCAHDA